MLTIAQLTTAFDTRWTEAAKLLKAQSFASDATNAYHSRQYIQSLIDMYAATGKAAYLTTASNLAMHAIREAWANSHMLLDNGTPRGAWPCWYHDDCPTTGGHNELSDFQCCAGLLMVAETLRKARRYGRADAIADFVENEVVFKWLSRYGSNPVHGLDSHKALLNVLDTGRDKLEHFAGICSQLHRLGRTTYPYWFWAWLLRTMYIARRDGLQDTARLPRMDFPPDWGITMPGSCYEWRWVAPTLVMQDTNHANRTVWLAAESVDRGELPAEYMKGFVRTFKDRIWDRTKLPQLYFRNCIDGTDPEVQGMGPGGKGNLWFGWHRLSRYDAEIAGLFMSLAVDWVTNDGEGIYGQMGHGGMTDAPLCLLAWAARMLKEGIVK